MAYDVGAGELGAWVCGQAKRPDHGCIGVVQSCVELEDRLEECIKQLGESRDDE